MTDSSGAGTLSDRPVSHAWDRIADLPSDWHSLARPDLDQALQLWDTERQSLKDPSRVIQLQEQLATRWAIETGVIERLYTIDRGTTETLVELGLHAIEQFSTTGRITKQAARLIKDQRLALDFVFSYIKENRDLSTSYIKELHQLLLRNEESTEAVDQFGNRILVDLVRGEWKKLPNNPLTPDGSVHEYCPPEFVQDEMDSLLRLHAEHEAVGVRPEVEAAWLHHRFTQIHPFQDGNGRVARALATLVFLKAGFLPLVIKDREHRGSYIQALEEADRGNLSPLVSLFANIQAQDVEGAITSVREIRGGSRLGDVVRLAAEAARRRTQQHEERLGQLTDRFMGLATHRLEEVAYELRQAFRTAGAGLNATVSHSADDKAHWWHSQIVNAAREYQYFADLAQWRRWVQLRLDIMNVNVPRWYVVVSFHHKEARAGLMAAVVFLTTSEAGLEDPRPVILGSANEFTYGSTSRLSDDDFRSWLDPALTRVLEVWQSRI